MCWQLCRAICTSVAKFGTEQITWGRSHWKVQSTEWRKRQKDERAIFSLSIWWLNNVPVANTQCKMCLVLVRQAPLLFSCNLWPSTGTRTNVHTFFFQTRTHTHTMCNYASSTKERWSVSAGFQFPDCQTSSLPSRFLRSPWATPRWWKVNLQTS